MKRTDKKSVAALVGATVVSAFVTPIAASADSNPFALHELSSGYTHVAEVVPYQGNQSTETAKPQEAKCGQGKCGAEMMKQPQMKCGAGMKQPETAPAQTPKAMEGKCAGMKMDGSSTAPQK
jgi:uncharacterized low-complexity protein